MSVLSIVLQLKLLFLLVIPISISQATLAQSEENLSAALEACYAYSETTDYFFQGGEEAFVYRPDYFARHTPRVDTLSAFLTTQIFAIKGKAVSMFVIADMAYRSVTSPYKAYSFIQSEGIGENSASIEFRLTTLTRHKVKNFPYMTLHFVLTKRSGIWEVDNVIKRKSKFKKVNY